MKYVRSYINSRQARFAELDFFKRLEADDAPEAPLSSVRSLTFWVMVFQDILRINESRIQDRALRRIASHHRAEDKGHDVWFLHDLAVIDGHLPDIRELFSSLDVTTRDSAYALVSEVYRATDDVSRVALLLVLESTGHVFFERVVAYAERVRFPHKLWYFARSHLNVELGHELFERQIDETLDAIELSTSQRAAVLEVVDRCFDAISEMIDSLPVRVERAPRAGLTEPRIALSEPPISAAEPSGRMSEPPVSMTIDRRGHDAAPLPRIVGARRS